jgi:NADPH-dependent ferric siderophore reductase
MVLVNTDGGRIIRRRYTIRRFDPVERLLDLHIVTDSSGPGWQWLSSLRTGDAVEAIGPRGKITLATGVEWHLFVGDEVAVPVISAMVEALPAGSRTVVVAEVTVVDDAAKIDSAVDMDWQWVLRGDRPAGDPVGLLAAATAVPLPVGVGHVYVFGEAGVVAQVGAAFEARGVERERMSTKAYWGRGRANASHGEPLRNG